MWIRFIVFQESQNSLNFSRYENSVKKKIANYHMIGSNTKLGYLKHWYSWESIHIEPDNVEVAWLM